MLGGLTLSSWGAAVRPRHRGPSADTDPPTVPANLAGQADSDTEISLTWDASTDDRGVAGYRVFRDGALVGSVSTPGFSDSGLTAETQYSYEVSAYDAAENSSAHSAAVLVTTDAATGEPPAAAIGEPVERAVFTGALANGGKRAVVPIASDTGGGRLLAHVVLNNNTTISAITDTKGNTWTVDYEDHEVTGTSVFACSTDNATPLVAGDTVQFDWDVSAQHWAFAIDEVPGIGPAAAQKAQATAVSQSPDSGLTAETTDADALVVGVMGFANGTNNGFTPGSGFSPFTTSYLPSSSGSRALAREYKVVSEVGQQRANGSQTLSVRWQAMCLVYPADGSGGADPGGGGSEEPLGDPVQPLDLDWSNGTVVGSWKNVQRKDGHQTEVITLGTGSNPPVLGQLTKAMLAEVHGDGTVAGSDGWPGNGSVRCLWLSNNQTDPSPFQNGREAWWLFAFCSIDDWASSVTAGGLFEIHSQNNLSSPGLAPYWLGRKSDGSLVWRICTGDHLDPSDAGSWEHNEDEIPVGQCPDVGWVLGKLHIVAREDHTGLVELWIDGSGDASGFSAEPTISRVGIPTVQFDSANKIRDALAYHQQGLYPGTGNKMSGRLSAVFGGVWRRSTESELLLCPPLA